MKIRGFGTAFISGMVLFILITSLQAVAFAHESFTDGMNDIKLAAKFLKFFPDSKIYTDYLAKGQLEFFLNHDKRYAIDILPNEPQQLREGSFVVVGGARGVEYILREAIDWVYEQCGFFDANIQETPTFFKVKDYVYKRRMEGRMALW